MTAQSVVDLKAAVHAELLPAPGGYQVSLQGPSGKKVVVETGENEPALYPSKAAAKKAVQRQNPALLHKVALKPRI